MGERCPKCDRPQSTDDPPVVGECYAHLTGWDHAGAKWHCHACNTTEDCDLHAVDWRARCLAAESELAAGARLLAKATDRINELEAGRDALREENGLLTLRCEQLAAHVHQADACVERRDATVIALRTALEAVLHALRPKGEEPHVHLIKVTIAATVARKVLDDAR